MLKIIFLVITTLSLFHSFAFAQAFTGRWIGVHTEWDTNSFCPLAAYMDFNPDSTWQLGLVDESEAPHTGKWAVEGGVLRLDTTHYAPELVSLKGDFLHIGRIQPMVFRRYKAVPMPYETVWERLAGQVWQSDSVQYLIAADGRVGIRNRRTGKQTVHYAEVLKMDESAFLVIRGSAHGREGNIRTFWQVISNEVGVLKLLGGSALLSNTGTETLRWARTLGTTETLQSTDFQSCNNCFERNQHSFFWGFGDSSAKLMDVFTQQYKTTEIPAQSGLIFVSFPLNCVGEIGPIELNQVDENYCNRPFDQRITDQIKRISRDQLPVSLFGKAETYDRLVSFTIRFTDGRITDIF